MLSQFMLPSEVPLQDGDYGMDNNNYCALIYLSILIFQPSD